MIRSLRRTAVSLALLAALAACGDPDDETTESPEPTPTQTAADTPSAAGPCLVTEQELQDISGTAQTLEEVPSDGLAELICQTAADERGVVMLWSVEKGGDQTAEGQRDELDGLDLQVSPADLGDGQTGWIGVGKPVGYPHAQLKTLLADQQVLEVTLTTYDTDSALTGRDLGEETLELSSSLVSAIDAEG